MIEGEAPVPPDLPPPVSVTSTTTDDPASPGPTRQVAQPASTAATVGEPSPEELAEPRPTEEIPPLQPSSNADERSAEPAEDTESKEAETEETETEETETEETETEDTEPSAPVDDAETPIPEPPAAREWGTAVGGLSFAFNLAKVDGRGEDADPIVRLGRDLGLVGVFDGMGGAGGTEYATPSGRHTGAYLASRTARNVAEDFLVPALTDPNVDVARQAAELHDRLRQALAAQLAGLNAPTSRLRSTLLRALPTTMAVAGLQRGELEDVDSAGWRCSIWWAGDSRIYLLQPDSGLHQLTVDDLRDPADALTNLRQDSVLSNAVSADTDFVIRSSQLDVSEPFLLLAATDGCFGYLPTPMHFAELLLSTLRDAADVDGWSAALQQRIAAVTGDDAALALLGVGLDFAQFQHAFEEQTARAHAVVAPLDDLSAQIRRIEQELTAVNERHRRAVDESWSAYRIDYERHLSAGGFG